MNGEIDSWAIRWYYTVFAHDGLALFPPRTLVVNMGFDGSGTHDRLALRRTSRLETSATFDLPAEVVESRQKAQVFDAISGFRPSSLDGVVRADEGRLRRGVSVNPVKTAAKYRATSGDSSGDSRVAFTQEEILILDKNRHQRDNITVGAGTHIRGQLFTFGHGGRITMGRHCYVGDKLEALVRGEPPPLAIASSSDTTPASSTPTPIL